MPTINKPVKKKRDYKKHDKSKEVSKLYNTSQWQNLREVYFMQHPLCELCLEKGIISPTEEIHHIKPISTGKNELEMKDLAFNPNNLKALCIKCHHKVHQEMKLNH